MASQGQGMRRPNKTPIFGDQNALVHLLGDRGGPLRYANPPPQNTVGQSLGSSGRLADIGAPNLDHVWVLARGRHTGDRTGNRDHHPGNTVPCEQC